MVDWTYPKDGGLNYPVTAGDIWGVDGHVIACGDLEKGAGKELCGLTGAPDLVYMDPPWNQGNVASFRTKAGADKATVGFDMFLNMVLDAASLSKSGHIFSEMGNQWTERYIQLAEARGWKAVTQWAITYYKKHPCRLIHFNTGTAPFNGPPLASSPDGLDDEDTPAWAIEHFSKPGDLVFDPCTGRGLVPQTAVKMGRRAMGTELHPNRMSVTLTKLALLTGKAPMKVGELACMQ